jgi:hypothetical protein
MLWMDMKMFCVEWCHKKSRLYILSHWQQHSDGIWVQDMQIRQTWIMKRCDREKKLNMRNVVNNHRRRCDRPGFRAAAIPPCLFMPLDLGRGVKPFEARHCSRLELRGPCVEIFFSPAGSTSMVRLASTTKWGYSVTSSLKGRNKVCVCITQA